MANKKAALRFSVKFIVGIILILVFMILMISFMRSWWEKSYIKLEEQIVIGAPKPYVEIESPEDYAVFEVGDEISFRSFVYTHTSKTKIIGYFWDFGDGTKRSRKEHDKNTYYEPGDYNVMLKVLNDLGGLGSDSITVRVFTKNKKNLGKYDNDSVFFIESKSSSDPEIQIDNWREILKVIPLTRWYDKNGDHKYEYVAIAKGEGHPMEQNDIKVKLDLIEKDNGVTFDMGSISLPGYSIRNEQTNDLANYFSYWEEYDSVVLVDYDNFKGALIAALFASYYNSPLVFIEDRASGDYLDYDNYLYKKKFYVIDDIPATARTYYIEEQRITDWTRYNSTDLRDPSRRINRIIELESKLLVKD